MKVVLFCGGLGTRLRAHSDIIPKPLVTIGSRPIIWNLMQYYAHFGHKEFVLCLGYRGELIREFFEQDREPRDWTIHYAETGQESTIAERLRAVAPYVRDEPLFLANYSDGLTDLALPEYVEAFQRHDAVAGFVAVRNPQSFHVVSIDAAGTVTAVTRAADANVWINGGFFVFRPSIFDYVHDGEELVEEPFHRLMNAGKLYSYKHHGFWGSIDTFKDKVNFDRRHEQGDTPWEVWKNVNA
jgi:glucose-1-phosphate cytidylyltransferase